jgi:disulfide oxidoreductase YuzD
MSRIVFGATVVCPTCIRRPSRRTVYGVGWLETSLGNAVSHGWKITRRYGKHDYDTCRVECPTCHGNGLITR